MTPSTILGADEMGCETAEIKTDDNIVVFKTDKDAGHGGAFDALKVWKKKRLRWPFLWLY